MKVEERWERGWEERWEKKLLIIKIKKYDLGNMNPSLRENKV